MNSQRRGHLPRSHQVNRAPRPETASYCQGPTVSVVRPIVWENEQVKKEYLTTVHKAFGKRLRDSTRHHQRVVRPGMQEVAHFRPLQLAAMTRELRLDQRQPAMERLAQLLQDRLYSLLKDVPSELPVELGRLACFDQQKAVRRRGQKVAHIQVVGAELAGWRGPKASYPCDSSGGTLVLHQLAAENALYREALKDVNPWFGADEVVADPFVALTETARPVNVNTLYSIENSLKKEHVLPHVSMLGDPIILLHPENPASRPIPYPVRELGQYGLQAA